MKPQLPETINKLLINAALWEEVAMIVNNATTEELSAIDKIKFYGYFKVLKTEMERRQKPKKRGKFKKRLSVLPVPFSIQKALFILTKEWIRRGNLPSTSENKNG